MTFASPAFLWALCAIALPVIIHLFNFRRYKKIYFSNVKFLKDIQMESKSRSRLRELLILACRVLAIACLVFAFAQPVITDNTVKKGPVEVVGLYIDNSFSMDNVGTSGPLLQNALLQARDLVRSMGTSVKFYLLTNDFEGKHQRLCQQEDMLNLLEEIKASATPRQLSEVIRRQREFLSNAGSGNMHCYLFSDLQKSTFDIGSIKPDTSFRYTIVPQLANKVNNLCVDTCWFETPLQQKGMIQKLHALVKNHGNELVELNSAKLVLNGQQAAISSFSLDPQQSSELIFTFTNKSSGFTFGSVSIDDYPVHFDDELYFAFNAQKHIGVTLVNGREQKNKNAFSSLFLNDSLFDLQLCSEQNINYAAFKNSDVLVLNELQFISSGLTAELQNFSSKGGVLIIVPPANTDRDNYNSALLSPLAIPAFQQLDTNQLRTDKIEYAGNFFEGVFEKREERLNLPVVRQHWSTGKNSAADFESLMNLQNGDVFLGRSKRGLLTSYLFSSPLSEQGGNFSRHALFVPAIYKMCFSSLHNGPLFYTAGSSASIPLGNLKISSETPPHIRGKNVKADILPGLHNGTAGMVVHTRGQVQQPGFYELTGNETPLLPLAFNFSRKESDLGCFSVDELKKELTDKNYTNVNVLSAVGNELGKQVSEEAQGKKIWKLFILLTLLFIALEALILRIFK